MTTNSRASTTPKTFEAMSAGVLADRSVRLRQLDAAIEAERDDGARGSLLLDRAIIRQGESNPRDAAADSVRAFELLLPSGRTDEAALAAAASGAMMQRVGDLEAAVDYAVEAMALVGIADRTLMAARAANAVATLFAQLSAFEQAFDYVRLATDIFAQNGEPVPVAACYTTCYVSVEAHHAGVHVPLGPARDAAMRLSLNASPITRKLLGPGMTAELSALDRPDLIGTTRLDDSEVSTAAPRLQAWFQLVLAMEAHGAGDEGTARDLLDVALPTLVKLGDEHRIVRAYRLRSETRAALGDMSGALADSYAVADTVRSWQIDQVGRLAVQISRRAELEQMQSTMQRRAIDLVRQINVDELTRTGSRRLLEARLDELAQSAGSVSVAVVDVDEFKTVNDQFGHAVGDAVLKLVGRALRSTEQTCAVLARYGGDEFVAVFIETGTTQAAAFAEQVRTTLSKTDWNDISPGLDIHVSAGVAGGASTDVRNVVERADAALFSAKRQGRNRYVVD